MNFEEEFGVVPMDFGFDQFDTQSLQQEPEGESEPDLTNVETMLLSGDWRDNPESRAEMSDTASSLIHDALRSSTDKKVSRKVRREGKEVDEEVPVLGPNGRFSEAGRDYLERSRQILKAAANDENGGLVYNELTGKTEVASWVKDAMRQAPQKPEEIFPQLEEYRNEQKALDENNPIDLEGYAKFTGKDLNSFSEGEKQAFTKQVAQMSFNPEEMGEEEIGRVVEGMPVINPANRHEINKVESWISSLDGFSDIDKKIMIDDYHDTIDRDIVDYARMFSAADAGPIESIWNRPLMEELEAHLQSGGNGVEFLRANQERMTKDAYGVTSEVAGTFRDAVMSIGTGATWLAGAALDVLPGIDGVGELASRPAQLWGELAEESASAYRNQKLFSVAGIDINRRDLTELTGQIGSFVALGGISALSAKFTTVGAARIAATKAAQASTEQAVRTIGQKSLDVVKAALADKTAYIGGVQASGISFGKTYNEIYKATGDAEEAYREASIQGVSDGLSALIATSVMNRVAPGMERVLGAPEGSLSGSLIQRMRASGASKAAMEETKQIFSQLKMSKELTNQFGKDLLKYTRDSMAKSGLRGIGPAGDILAEGVEESFDEMLSDVIEVLVDDSKTWSEDGWPQIQQNWRGYVKAAVLGAIGGGMGSSYGAAKSGIKALGSDTQRKEIIKNNVAKEWDLLKSNVSQFENRDFLLNIAGKVPVKIGEILASDMSINEKSKYLVDFARKGQLAFGSRNQKKAEVPAAGTVPTGAAPTGSTGPSVTPSVDPDSNEGILSSIGYSLPAGRTWKSDLSITESANPSKGKEDGVTVTPLIVGGASMVGAKVTTVDSSGNQSSRYVSASEAATLVKDKRVAANYQSVGQEKALAGSDVRIESWSDVAPAPSQISTGEILSQMGYSPGENQSWDDEVETNLEFMERTPNGDLNPITIGGVPYAGAKLTKKDANGNETVSYISAAEAADLSTDNKKSYEKSVAELDANVSKWTKQNEKGTDTSGTDGQMQGTGTNRAEVAGDAEGGNLDEADGNRGDAERGSPTAAEEAEEVKAEKKTGSIRVVAQSERAESLREKLSNNEEVKAAIAAGVDFIIVESLDQLSEIAEGSPIQESAFTRGFDGAAYVTKNGEELVVLNVSIDEKSDSEVSEIVAHEVIHLAEFRFRGTKDGLKLWKNAIQIFDPQSPYFDKEFNSFMEKEYPEFNGLSLQLKLSEASRAFVQGKLNKFSFAGENPFLQYLEDFLNYVRSAYGEFSDASKYFQEIEKAYAEMSVAAETNEAAKKNEELKSQFVTEITQNERDDVAIEANEILDDSGIKFSVKPRPEKASIPANASLFEGNEDVWIELSTNEIGVSPEFIDRVIADEKIDDKEQHIADKVSSLVSKSGVSLQALTPSTAPTAEVDPISETPKYIVPEDELNGTTDSAGGKWSSSSENKNIYTYTPGKGMVIDAKVGDVVSIGGDTDNVLVFLKVDPDGAIVYVKVNMTQFGTTDENSGEFKSEIHKLNKNWQKNRLLSLTKMVRPQLSSILAGDTSDASINALRKILKAVMNEVAPGKDFIESTDPNTNFIQSVWRRTLKLVTNANGETETEIEQVPFMEVNLASTIQELKSLLGSANLANPKAEFLVSMEVSRLLSKWVEEEQVHLITMDHSSFSQVKISNFVKEVAKNKDHPLHALFVQTVKERAPNSDPVVDRRNPRGLNEEQRYIVGSELLRKVQQIRAGGSFSEQANTDARRLVYSLAQDAMAGKSLFKSAAEMIRRYMDRIHKVLWFRSIRGQLSVKQLEILDILDAEYRRRNIRGDVDYTKDKATEFMVNRMNSYYASTEDEIASVAREFSNPLIKLRGVINQFDAFRFSDIIDVNDKFELFIVPQVRQFMEDSKLYDMAEIDEAILSLNEKESFRKVWTETYIAKQVMESREAELEFDPTEFFKMLEGNKFDPNGVMFQILKGIPNTPEGSEFLADHLDRAYQSARANREQVENELIIDELRLIQNLDPRKSEDRIALLEKAKFYGMPLDVDSFENGTYFNLNGLQGKLLSRAEMMLQDPDILNKVAKLMGSSKNPKIASYSGKLDQLKAIENAALIRKNRVRSSINKDGVLEFNNVNFPLEDFGAISSPKQQREAKEVASLKQQREAKESGADMELARERYLKLRAYLDSVDSFNNKIETMKERAFGYVRPNTKDHGLYIRDTRNFVNNKMVLGPREDIIEAATTPSEVFFYNYYPSTRGARTVAGDGYPKNWSSDRDSTKDKDVTQLHVTTIDSNASFLGRNARMNYYIADLMGNVPGSFNRELYNSSAGFAFEGSENDYDQTTYENPEVAFPRFDGFKELKNVQAKLDEDKQPNASGLFNIIAYITKAEAWLDHIDQRINPKKIITEVAGMQTPAGRASIILQPRFKDLRENLEFTKNLVIQKLSPYVKYNANSEGDFASRFERDKEGKLILMSDSAAEVFKAIKESLRTGKGTKFSEMYEAQMAANSDVKSTRRMVREFVNPKWIKNVEREAIQTIRNAAYRPDHPEMLQLRDAILDPAIMRNMGFAMKYFSENESNYWVGPMYALDALKDYSKISGRGYEQKAVKGGIKKGVIKEGENKGEVYTQELPAQPTDIVFSYGESGNDDPRVGKSDSGEFGVTLDSYLQDKFSEKLSGAELAALTEDAPKQSLKMWLTSQLMFIGYRSQTNYGNVDDARNFAFDVMRKQLTLEGNTADLVETAIAGMFPSTQRGTKRFETLVKFFYRSNKHWTQKDSIKRFDAESFVVDLLEFKRRFEESALKQARFKSNETIAVLSSALDASSHPKEEKDEMKRVVSKGLISGDVLAYDSRLVDQYNIYLGESPVVSMMLMNLVGETIIVQPTKKQTTQAGTEIGLRVIPGKEGQPNIVWVPNSGASRLDQQIAIQTILSHYGEDPAMKETIVSLANSIRNTLLPAFDLDQTERAIQHHLDRIPAEKRKSFTGSALSHFIKLSRITDEISPSDITGTSAFNIINYKEKFSPSFASDISLITSVFTDPKYKEAFDRGYIGTDVAQEFGLPDAAVDGLNAIVKRLRETDGDYVYWAEENATEDVVGDDMSSLGESYEDLDQEFDTGAGRADPEVSEMMKTYGITEDELERKMKSDEDRKKNSTANANKLIEILDPDRLKAHPWEEVVPPSDMVIFNALGSLLANVKSKNDMLDPVLRSEYREKRNEPSRLTESPVSILRRERETSSLFEPIFPELNRPDTRNVNQSMFVGSAINLTRPNVHGHTMLKLMMDATRSRTQQAAWIAKIPDVALAIDSAVIPKLKSMNLGVTPRIELEIPLDDDFMNHASDLIPQLASVREQVEESLLKISETEQMLLDRIQEANEILNIPLKWSNEETITEEMAESNSLKDEMVSLIQRLAQTISGASNETLAYEQAMTAHAIQAAIEAKYGDFMPEMRSRISDLYRLIRKRDSSDNVLASSEFNKTTESISRHLEWFNTATQQINKVANNVVDGRLSQIGIDADKKKPSRRKILSPLGRNPQNVSLADVDSFAKALNSGKITANKVLFDSIFNEASNQFTSRILDFAERKSGKAKVLFQKGFESLEIQGKKKGEPQIGIQGDKAKAGIIEFLKKAKDLNRDQIFNLVNSGFGEEYFGGDNNVFKYLNMIALGTVEAHELFQRKAETGEERTRRERAESTKRDAEKHLGVIRDQRVKMFDTGGSTYIGKFRHVMKQRQKDGKPMAANIEISVVDPLVQIKEFESTADKFARRDKWRQSENSRKNFYILREALTRSLDEIADGRVDAMYKKLRGQTEEIGGFNPVKIVMDAQRRIQIEDSVFKDQLNKVQGLVADADLRELSAEALAFMTNSSDVLYTIKGPQLQQQIEDAIKAKSLKLSFEEKEALKEQINSKYQPGDKRYVSEERKEVLKRALRTGYINNLTDQEKAKIKSDIEADFKNLIDAKLKANRLPQNFNSRRNLIGELFNDPENGGKVILVPQDAKARLMRAFPNVVNERNANSTMREVALKALSQSSAYPSFMDQNGPPDAKFRGSKFKLTKDKADLTIEEAGRLFSDRFKVGLSNYLQKTRNGKEVDLTGENSKRAVNFYGTLVEKLVYAYNAEKLVKADGSDTRAQIEIEKILTSIDNQGNAVGNLGFDSNDQTFQDFDLIGTFALAFAELESEQIMMNLVSGLSIQDGYVPQNLLKYVHHQDARNRSKFMKSKIARDVAIHLQAYLERGFDNSSGRSGHQAAHKSAQDAIAAASRKFLGIQGSAKDQAIGYMLAQLKGLNDASGMTLTQALGAWKKTIDAGWQDLKDLDRAQKNAFKSKAGRFLNANHVDMIRDIPLIESIYSELQKSGTFDDFGLVDYSNEFIGEEEAKDQNSRKVIKALEEALKAQTKNQEGVKNYADAIYDQLLDAYNATAVTRAVTSKRLEEEDKTGNRQDDEGLSPTVRTYSSVPIKLAYAANPDSAEVRTPTEGQWIPDPADVVDIRKSAFYGGFGRQEREVENAPVLRPISLNGLAAPFAILEDSLYRTNITPNYLILRKLLGRVQNPSGVPIVDKSLLISPRLMLSSEYKSKMKDFKVAVSAVASEIETVIFNDSQVGVVNTAFAQAANFASSVFVVRSLASLQQLWNQTLPAATFFVIKKLSIGKHSEAHDFLKILSKLIGSMAADFAKSPRNFLGGHENKTQFHHRVTKFTKEVSPYIYFRGVDGQDQSREALRHQTRFNQSKFQSWGGRFVKEYQNTGEAALDFTIGSGERLISKAIFLTELMSEMKRANTINSPNTVEDLLSNFNSRNIPVLANRMAEIKVSDMMGQSDVSKKSTLFQNRSDSPVWSSLWKSLTRFSNHTASTSSNMTALLPALKHGDEETKQEALENIVGTLGQNVMFQFFKIHTLLPLALSVFYMFDGDDEEEASRKAQEKANEILGTEESGPVASMFKQLAFGSEKELFQSFKQDEASVASAKAEMLGKTAMEFSQAIPYVGVLFGYSPISSIAKPIVNNSAEEVMSFMSRFRDRGQIPVAQAWYERDAIGVREFNPGVVETIASATAPTSVVYDALESGVLSYKASDAGASTIDILTYMASEVVPFLRDYRSAKASELRETIKENER